METEHPVLALDHGEARIGVAATDPVGIMAHPVETIQVKTTDVLERVAQLVEERQIKQIVLGLPLNMSGTEGPCLLYTSPSPRDLSTSRMPSSA